MPSRTNHDRDNFIIQKLNDGKLFSDIVRDVNRRFGGSYTCITSLVRRLSQRIMGQNLSHEERLCQYKKILAGAWSIYNETESDKIKIAALGLLTQLIDAKSLLDSGKDKVDQELALEIVEAEERSA